MNKMQRQRNGFYRDLPPEVKAEISKRCGECRLGHVDTAMRDISLANWNRIYGPHKGSYEVQLDTIERIIGEFNFAGRFTKPLAVHLILPSFPPGLRSEMKRLYGHIGVHDGGVRTLDITLLAADIVPGPGVSTGEAAAAIIQRELWHTIGAFDLVNRRYILPFLEGLKVNCSSLSLGRQGVGSLMTYYPRDVHLHTLWLDLSDNDIGDDGCLQLFTALDMAYRRTDSLKKLQLGLKNNQIGPEGARYLAGLQELASLESFHIDLENNRIGDLGAERLSRLSNEPDYNPSNIRTLHLNCENNGIGDRGVAFFAAGTGDRLRDLHLNLNRNLISDMGIQSIADWNVWYSQLESVNIHAHDNPGTKPGQ
jgi:hypothetical protein